MSLHATVDTRSPTPTTTERTDHSLRQLAQAADEHTVEAMLQAFLARRRAVRQARREQAAEQARHEHELLVQRALIGAGVAHLR